MGGYALRRFVLALPLLAAVATLVFSLIHLIPGDPVETMLGPAAGSADIVDLRHRLGLDRPLWAQYVDFMSGLSRGDLGRSLHYRDPVTALILERLPATLVLAGASLLLALATALPAGVLAAMRPGGATDRLAAVAAMAFVSMPTIGLGPLLILLFALRLDLLPISGMDRPASLVLPAMTLAAGTGALLTRLVRTFLRAEIEAPYFRAALSRGCRRGAAVTRHALRNALAPILTVAALQAGSLLTGAILTETIFAWPGLGRLLVFGITHRDYPLVQGCVLTIAATYVTVNLLADLAVGFLEPRAAS